jgi:hypothetical protein
MTNTLADVHTIYEQNRFVATLLISAILFGLVMIGFYIVRKRSTLHASGQSYSSFITSQRGKRVTLALRVSLLVITAITFIRFVANVSGEGLGSFILVIAIPFFLGILGFLLVPFEKFTRLRPLFAFLYALVLAVIANQIIR